MSNSKNSKKDKELDIILEQLKKSYGAESSDTIKDVSSDSSEYEEDVELNAVLSKIFSEEQETSESESENYAEDSNEFEDDYIELENANVESESLDEAEIKDVIVEDEPLDENEIEDVIVEAGSLDEYNETEEIEETEELEEASIEYNNIDEPESANLEAEFAVEDEEYDVLPYSVPEELEPASDPEDSIEIAIEETEVVPEEAPVLILDPAQYTYDPLQEGLPKFKSITAKAEQTRSDSDIIEENDTDGTENFDNNDISLLLKLGYDDEIKSKVGGEKTENVILESNRNFVPEDNQKPYGFCGEELTDRGQIPKISQKYQSNKRSLLITLASVFVLFLMILSVTVYFDTYSSRTDSFPILIMIEFILVAIIAAILYKKLYVGIMGMIKLVADQYSVLSFVLAVYVLYDISALVTYAINRETIHPSELTLFGTCVALYALLTVAADLVNCIKEASAFDLIASSNKLFTAEKITSDALNHTHNEKTYKIRKTTLISGYFKKTTQSKAPSVNLIYILGVVPLAALIIGCAFAISRGSVLSGISSATVAVFLCIPLSCVCILPFNEYVTSLKLGVNKLAFIGYDAATEYSKIQNIIFKDRDVISITSYSEIQPQNVPDSNFLNMAYEVFNALGGTIAEYKSSTANTGQTTTNKNIIINSISDNGIDVTYTTSTNILFGDKHYMKAHNIKVKTDSTLFGATKGADRSVLYMAFDGIAKLGFILGSSIDPRFIKSAHELEAHGVKVFVESCEPHINDLYFEQNTEERLAVAVFKPKTHKPLFHNDTVDGNVISASDGFNLAKIVPISKRIVHQRKICKYINYGLITAGFILSCLLAFVINSRADSVFFEFIKAHCSLIINFILLMGIVPGLIALLRFKKDKTKTNPTTIQNGDTKQK